MTKEEFIKELNKRRELYLKKSSSFNEKNTLLFIKAYEKAVFLDFSKNFKITFDEILENEENICEILKERKNTCNYFFSNEVMNDALYKELLAEGIKEENIYVGPTKDSYFDLYEKRENIYRNADKISKVFSFLEDEKSKNVYLNILTRLTLSYQYHYYYESEDFEQYFPDDFIFTDEEVYLDGGVYDGKNIFQFLERVNNNYKFIYAFEADPNNYLKAKNNLKNIEKIKFYQKALYKDNEELSFLSTDNSTKKGNAHVQPSGDILVQACKADDLELKPSFIKMDIEGSEKDALLGLQNTIKNHQPKLAICIYHFQEDFWELPLLMKELNPNYKVKIRNHEKMLSLLETVCYAK